MAKVEDSWWEKKIKERSEYKRFREGIDHETTDLWTGKRCVAPTMDPSAIPVDEEEGGGAGEFDWEQELEEVGDVPLDTPLEVEMTGLTIEEDGDDELNGGNLGSDRVGQQAKGKRARTTFEGSPSNPVPIRKGKRLSNNQSTYNQHLEMMGQTSEKLFSMLDIDDEGSSQRKKGRKVHDLDDALPVIEEMVEKGVIVEGGELWCISMAKVLNEESRQLFMRLKSDFARISWLEFRLKHKRA